MNNQITVLMKKKYLKKLMQNCPENYRIISWVKIIHVANNGSYKFKKNSDVDHNAIIFSIFPQNRHF